MGLWFKLLVLNSLVYGLDGVCTFPSDLTGQWLASNMGSVNFTSDTLEGYLACKFTDRAVCEGVPTTWECHETDGGEQFVLRTPFYMESGVNGRLYMCLYLSRLSSTKYLFYQGPQDDHSSSRLSYVVAVIDGMDDPLLTSVCDLTSPFPFTRHHVLIREDDILSAKSFCPSEFLASFSPAENTTGCASDLKSCDTKQDVTVANVTCSPRVLYTENGTLSCLHSLADGDVVYVTLYNQDDSTDGSNSYQFVCVALLLENNQVFFNQNPMDCDDFSVLNATVADFIMDPVFWCPITCSFESALQGDWLSNRKGELTISADTVSGFEPYGLTCTDCTDQPTDFECYQQSGSIYLIRSARTFLNSLPVRIYVCLDMTFVSSTKYIYYQAHSAQASDLEDYLAVLNAAQPVNSLTEVCTQSTPYPPELHSVLLSAASPQSGAAACPEQFVSVYNTSVSSCDFTLSACDVDTQLKLSSTSCDNSPFYTTGGVLSCIYSITDGSTTYLTLLNHDSSTDSNSTFQFTCIASELDGTNLRFTETSGGCHEGQTPSTVNTTNGAEHLFLYLEECPSSSFPWIIIIGVAAGVIFLILVALVIYCCCGRRCLAERRARNKESEEESIIGSKDGDGVEGDDGKKTHWRETNEKDDRRYKDIFTVGTARNPITRGLGKSKKRKRRKRKHGKERSAKEGRDGSGDSSSGSSGSGSGSDYSDDFTSDDSDTSLSSEARIRKMLGSRYNLHVALAWSNRENDPELVQDEHQPQNRHFYESKEMLLRGLEASSLTFNKSKPLGRIVSTSAVLGPANWRKRSQRDRGDQSHLRDGRRIGVDDASLDKDRSAQFLANGGRRRLTRLDPIQSQGRLDGTRDVTKLHKGFGLLKPEHMEFLAQYQAYTTTRKILEDEGFFDTQLGHTLLAGEQFGFNKQEELLNPSKTPEETKDALEDFSSEVALAGQRERQKASRRVMISARPAATAVLPHSDQGGTRAGETQPDSGTEGDGGGTSVSEGAASGQRDGNSTATGGSRASTGNERGSSAATATSDLMSRFYARLQELTETKEEDDRAASNGDVATRNKDRMRIKTALRRLLNSRLFPDKVKDQKDSSRGKLRYPDDGSSIAFTPGTTTPITLESRSNTFYLPSRQNIEDGSSKPVTRGKVVFVGESSHLTSSSTDTPDTNGRDGEGQQRDEADERVAYYRRHPLGPLKTGGISRLYQPVRPPSRSRTSLSQTSAQRAGLKGDQAFLQRVHQAQGVREDTRWSVPGEKGPENYISTQPPRSGWRRERVHTAAWSYNMAKLHGEPDDAQKSPSDLSIRNHVQLKDLDDLDLRKLLEEMYRDKKYMDKIINTMDASDQTEEEVCSRLEDGRDYLLARAQFWKERGPLPPRPPTTDLGLRLQRERTLQSRMTTEGTVSRQGTNVSRANMGESQEGADSATSSLNKHNTGENQKAEKENDLSPRQGQQGADNGKRLSRDEQIQGHQEQNDGKNSGDEQEKNTALSADNTREGDLQLFGNHHQEMPHQDGSHQNGPHQERSHQDGPHQEGPHLEGSRQDGPHQDGPHLEGSHQGAQHREPLHTEQNPDEHSEETRIQRSQAEGPGSTASEAQKENVFIISK